MWKTAGKWEKEVERLGLEKLYESPVLVWIRPYQQETHLFQKTEAAEQKEIMEYASSLLKQFQFLYKVRPAYG